MSHLTITLAGPFKEAPPGWTAAAVAHAIENALPDFCDLPGLVVLEAVES